MRRLKLWLCLLLPASVFGLFMPAAAPAASDYFLEIDGIRGESNDKQFKDAIDVLSYSWGVSNSSTATSKGGGKAAAAPNFSDFNFMKRVDSASVALFSLAASGGRVRSATLTARKAGEVPVQFLTFCLGDVGVSSVQQSGSGGDDLPTESFSLNYGSIVQVYRPQSSKGGFGNLFAAGWDLTKNLANDGSGCGGAGSP